jgi:1-deoxy-D-xylulose-5-phosphate reductoisomerase
MRLDFEAPDTDRFPALNLAYEAGRTGGAAPAWLSAANEVAVDAFLQGGLHWRAIPTTVAKTLESYQSVDLENVDALLAQDRLAREVARRVVAGGE